MVKKAITTVTAVVVQDEPLSLLELCRALGTPAERVVELVEYGVVEPVKGREPKSWQFNVTALVRSRTALRLRNDLQVEWSGLPLALDLLEEVRELRRRVDFLERHWKD